MRWKNKYYVIGVMSGTSLDGLDTALCEFVKSDEKWFFNLIDYQYTPYTNEFRQLLESAYHCPARQLVEIDARFGIFIADEVNKIVSRNNISVDLVASHGQTIFHMPENGYTCQIGSGAHIAELTGITTVCDFRTQDVVMGGQGAPLVPIGDALLFSDYAACLNLGGFANISYEFNGKRIAYDICPVNIVLNYLSGKLSIEYDLDGKLAQSGSVINNTLDILNKLDFYRKEYPKSLGKEWVDKFIYPVIKDVDPVDGLRTFVQHIAHQISVNIGRVDGAKVLVTGGGAKNKYLIQLISQMTSKEIIIPQEQIIDMKEAIVFAFLGVLRLRGEINCLASVTGAKRDSCSGAIYLP